MRRFEVSLGTRSYPIISGRGLLDSVGSLCRDLGLGKSAVIVSNSTVGNIYGQRVFQSLGDAGIQVHSFHIPDGEYYKNSATLDSLYDVLIDAGLDRKSFLVALGGGVVGDLTGFAAATFLRGIDFVQVPTTLLAQVDSSVGGKTGINHSKGKNLIGAFYQPRCVVIDPATLDTLPDREFRSGFAEIVKYGVVCDRSFFDFVANNAHELLLRDSDLLLDVIMRSCEIKSEVVANDECESGYRAVLNYGHTFAHAVEKLSGYGKYLHGEAVSIGMVLSSRLSERKGYALPSDSDRILGLLKNLNLPVDLPVFSPDAYYEAMLCDKKVRERGINFVFNRGIGHFIIERVSNWEFLLDPVREMVTS